MLIDVNELFLVEQKKLNQNIWFLLSVKKQTPSKSRIKGYDWFLKNIKKMKETYIF